jgi:hypothetical protein
MYSCIHCAPKRLVRTVVEVGSLALSEDAQLGISGKLCRKHSYPHRWSGKWLGIDKLKWFTGVFSSSEHDTKKDAQNEGR